MGFRHHKRSRRKRILLTDMLLSIKTQANNFNLWKGGGGGEWEKEEPLRQWMAPNIINEERGKHGLV